MTHCGQGTLRAYLDGELGGEEQQAVRRHVAGCEACRGELAALGAGAAWAGRRLGGYAREVEGGQVDAVAAWKRMEAVWGKAPRRAAEPRRSAVAGRRAEGVAVRRRTWPVASAAAALALGSLAFSPVRAAAASMLQIFRVQQVQVVQVSPADVASIQKALQSAGSIVDIRGLARVRVIQATPPATVSLAAARQEVGFPLAVPSALPPGYTLSQVRVQSPTRVDFSHLQVAAINRLLTSLGSRELLPAAVGGASIDLSIPSAAELHYSSASGNTIRVGETLTPTLSVPAGVDVNAVRQVLLNLPFLPPSLRSQLQAVSDWQDTAVIPQVPGVSAPVMVGGAQGVFIQTHDPEGDVALVWLSGGVVRVVEGVLTEAEANSIALGMH